MIHDWYVLALGFLDIVTWRCKNCGLIDSTGFFESRDRPKDGVCNVD